MFCQSIETVSLSLYHLGTWELWGHLCAPDKPQAAWRSGVNSPAHTCYCCAVTGQPSLGVCSLFGHPPLAHLLKPANSASVVGFRHAYLGDCYGHSVTPEGLVTQRTKEGAMMLA